MNRINRMHQWTGTIATVASLLGVLAIAPAHEALAQTASDADTTVGTKGAHGHGFARHDWIHVALELPSLSADQRAAIEQLAGARRIAMLPVRQADANLLTVLAQQVEAGAVDPHTVMPAAQAKQAAALSARAAEQDIRQKLHGILTPAQRSQLVDALESRMPAPDAPAPAIEHARLDRIASRLGLSAGQQQQILSNLGSRRGNESVGDDAGSNRVARGQARRAWLESFRAEAFDAARDNAGTRAAARRDRITAFVEAAAPVLTAAQRAELAAHLRQRAARETRHG